MRKTPLDRTLNAAVLHIAALKFPRGFDVSPSAPDTFEKLCALLDSGARMHVFDGGSDATIFGDASVNHAFRAWHDWHHYRHALPFTPEGEARACLYQVADLVAEYGDNATTRQWARILDAEINGQLAYCAARGAFPDNQDAFTRAYLDNPQLAIATAF